MLNNTKQFLYKIRNVGTRHYSDKGLQLKIQIMNDVILITMLIGLGYALVGCFQNEITSALINILVVGVLISCLYLVYKKNYVIAWYIILILPAIVLTFLPLISEMVITAMTYYLVFQTLAFAFFDNRKTVAYFSGFYLLSALLFLYFLHQESNGAYHLDDFTYTAISLGVGILLEYSALLIFLTIREEQIKASNLTEATFKSVFENSPIGVIVSQRAGNTPKMINDRMATMFGYPIDEFSMKKISEISHPDDKELHQPFYKKLLNGEISFFEMEKRYIHKNGNTLWGRTAISLVRNEENEPIYTVAMIQNITQHKEQEQRIHQLLEKLKGLNSELEQTVDERTKNLIKTNEELMRSNQDLEQFAYAASHDLQEPLRMVGNFVQLLDRRYAEKLDENGKTYINFAVEGVTRMSTLITSLLQYSRAGRKESEVKVVDIRKVIEYKLLDLEQMVEDKNASVIIHEMPKEITCEPVQIGLVFYNLIVNGLKFNKKNQPTLNIQAKELEDHWCFSVVDNGIGIEEMYKEKIFEIFKRLNRRDEYHGTGVGLALCKKIVYRHKGKIWFDSTLDKGTTFHFTIAKELHQN
jgi:PAS domain S-box-containing protein